MRDCALTACNSKKPAVPHPMCWDHVAGLKALAGAMSEFGPAIPPSPEQPTVFGRSCDNLLEWRCKAREKVWRPRARSMLSRRCSQAQSPVIGPDMRSTSFTRNSPPIIPDHDRPGPLLTAYCGYGIGRLLD